MAVTTPLRGAPEADRAGAAAPPADHGTVAWFRVGTGGRLSLAWAAPLPADAAAAARPTSPVR